MRPEADCGSDHGILSVKFRLKLKKVGKTTRPFRYDLNQILYNCTVEVTNRSKGLDLIECLKNYGWRFITMYMRGKEIQKVFSEEALQIVKKRREVKGKGEKERYTHLNAESQRRVRREKKSFLSEQCKEIEENNRMRKTRDLQENQRCQRNISCKNEHSKGQKWYGINRRGRY